MTLPVDTLLQGGKYRIVRFISSGGFGCTYEAIHVNMEERVAIKEFFVKDFCNRDETTAHITVGTVGKRALVDKLRRKFADEARALYKLKHPGIVRVSDVFEENGTAYYVMDYVDGLSLGEIVKRDGALPEARAVRYIRQVAEALRYVHDHNRLHLDIKPGNIMIDSDDNAILIDFGASKQYDEEAGENTSTLMGKTPGYAPLEQMGNDVVKFLPATDIYALGATLYKLLTGITPLSANVLASGEELDPLPETISEPTRRAISAAMQIRKNDRPQTIDAFLALLDASTAAASDETVFDDDATVVTASQQAPHQSTPQPKPQPAAKTYKSVLPSEPKRSFFGRHKWLTAAACIAIFAVIGFVMLRVISSNDTHELISVSPATGSIDGHDYVDMGLSVMWATYNVGATSPSDFGDYFAWGETTTKSEYTEENSKTNNKSIGDIAGNPKYDAARANWGGQWRMPTKAEMEELRDNSTWEFVIVDGYYRGLKFTSKINGNSIFLTSHRDHLDDGDGYYWSSTPHESDTSCAYGFYFFNSYLVDYDMRDCDQYIRPVFDPNAKDNTTASSKAPVQSAVDSTPKQPASKPAQTSSPTQQQVTTTNQKALTGTIAGHEWVDLGLSVKWATCNVGASTPSAYGNYYAWGETNTKSEFFDENCKTWERNMRDISGDYSYDAARVNWGGSWRMPTKAEMQELVNKCTWTWTSQGGHNGYKVTSKTNGNSIFLPAAGIKDGSSLLDVGVYGDYWSSTPSGGDSQRACYLFFCDVGYDVVDYSFRSFGQSVRPVSN